MVNRPIEIDGIKYFKCKKCGEVKPLNKSYFHINTIYSTGFLSKCKSCVKEERDSKPKVKYITRAELEEENKELKEFKTKREESMFYFKAQMERADPKTSKEAEDLHRAKEIFEKLYRKELDCLEKENKELKEAMKELNNYNKFRIQENEKLKEEIKLFNSLN